jgi:rRNA processing protein Gar1
MSATRQAVAEQGDIVRVSGRRVGQLARMGEVLEVIGTADHPHYVVRWEDGHQSILYPGETTASSGGAKGLARCRSWIYSCCDEAPRRRAA